MGGETRYPVRGLEEEEPPAKKKERSHLRSVSPEVVVFPERRLDTAIRIVHVVMILTLIGGRRSVDVGR